MNNDNFVNIPIDYSTAVNVTLATLKEYKKMMEEDNRLLNARINFGDDVFDLYKEDLDYNLSLLESINTVIHDLMNFGISDWLTEKHHDGSV
jgi:hypothetical protein